MVRCSHKLDNGAKMTAKLENKVSKRKRNRMKMKMPLRCYHKLPPVLIFLRSNYLPPRAQPCSFCNYECHDIQLSGILVIIFFYKHLFGDTQITLTRNAKSIKDYDVSPPAQISVLTRGSSLFGSTVVSSKWSVHTFRQHLTSVRCLFAPRCSCQ